jgi:hypothetical protein
MKLPNFNANLFRTHPRLSLPTALTIGWWALVALLIAFLTFDGFLFFQYGLGRAEEPAVASGETVLSFHQEVIRAAAAKIQERQTQFEAASTIPADLPNPFR